MLRHAFRRVEEFKFDVYYVSNSNKMPVLQTYAKGNC